MKFVTAIYNGLHHSDFGGRLNRDFHYLYSLRCLAQMGVEIICYTTFVDKHQIEEYLGKYLIKNVQFKIFELSSLKYHRDITRIKKLNSIEYANDNIWVHRCVELMWLKIQWIKMESDNHPSEKIFWIDAGLSHGGIFPRKFNSAYDVAVEQSHQHDLAFNRKLTAKLDKLTDSKLFTFYCTNRQHQYPKLYENEFHIGGSVVAGLFGGTRGAIDAVKTEFDEIVKYIISHDTLMPEELILTLIYKNHPELFETFDFGTWYHEDWECFNRELIPFCAFFEDLL